MTRLDRRPPPPVEPDRAPRGRPPRRSSRRPARTCRPAQRLRRGRRRGHRRHRPEGGDRRRLRRSQRGVRPRDVPRRPTACRPVRRPTAASRRSTRPASTTSLPSRTTPAGARRSRSTSTWSRRSARTARSSSSRRRRSSFAEPRGGGQRGSPRSARRRSPTATAGTEFSGEASPQRPTTSTLASTSPSAPATAATASSSRRHPSTCTAVGGTSLVPDSSNARGWTETAWSSAKEGAGSGCSALHPQADLAARHRLRQAHRRRRLGGRRPEHGGRRLRQLQLARLAGVRRDERRLAARRQRRCPRRRSRGHGRPRRIGRYAYAQPDQFNDVTGGSNGIVQRDVPLHRRGRLRRPDRSRHAQRRGAGRTAGAPGPTPARRSISPTSPVVGQPLSANPGTWSGSRRPDLRLPMEQLLDHRGDRCLPVAGATRRPTRSVAADPATGHGHGHGDEHARAGPGNVRARPRRSMRRRSPVLNNGSGPSISPASSAPAVGTDADRQSTGTWSQPPTLHLPDYVCTTAARAAAAPNESTRARRTR